MTEEGQFVAEADPLEISRGTDDSGEPFVRFEVTIHPPLDADTDHDLSHQRHLFDNADEHVHPQQDEHMEVLAGEYGVTIEGTDHVLSAGEEITVPAGTTHSQWNATDRPIRVVHRHYPPRESAAIYESLFALAQAGATDEKGMPNPLQVAVVVDEYPGHTYRPSPSVGVQKAMFGALAVVGRVLGYEATHSREDTG